MAADHTSGPNEDAELQALTSFYATVERRWDRTAVDVFAAEAAAPVARVVKAGSGRKRLAYRLLTGPGLETESGTVTESGGVDAAGVPFGIVNLSDGKKRDDEIRPLAGGIRTGASSDNPTTWRIVQPGLPPLTGRGANKHTARKYRRSKVKNAVDWLGIDLPVPWIPTHGPLLAFHYGAPGCEGFTVSTAAADRMDVTVHDPRIDRRLILACLTALTLHVMWTWKGEVINGAHDLGIRPRPKSGK